MKKLAILLFSIHCAWANSALFLKEETLNYHINEMPEYIKFKEECNGEIKYNFRLLQTNREGINQKLKRFFEYDDEKEFQKKILKIIIDKNCEAKYYQFNHAFNYLGHFQNLEMFQYHFYEFSEGNQGYGGNAFYVFNSQDELLSLDDIFNPEELKVLLNALLPKYMSEKMAKNISAELPQIEIEKLISHNFYFDAKGLIFYYPPYSLDSNDEHEYSLILNYSELKELLPEHIFFK